MTFKNEWLDALRSNEYEQGWGCLRVNKGGIDQFCCLGLAENILDPEGWDVHDPIIRRDDTRVYLDRTGDDGLPQSDEIRNAIAVAVGADETDIVSVMEEMAADNDSGVSFAEIADRIEDGTYGARPEAE